MGFFLNKISLLTYLSFVHAYHRESYQIYFSASDCRQMFRFYIALSQPYRYGQVERVRRLIKSEIDNDVVIKVIEGCTIAAAAEEKGTSYGNVSKKNMI